MNFLFGEPRFISSLDPAKTDKKTFKIEDEGLQLANRLEQKRVARDCAAWLRQKVEIKSIRHAQLLHGKMYHIAIRKVCSWDAPSSSSWETHRTLAGHSPDTHRR